MAFSWTGSTTPLGSVEGLKRRRHEREADGGGAPRLSERGSNIGDHILFSIMTTEPNGVVEPVQETAMPVMLMTADDVDHWLRGWSVEDALGMQKPAPDDAVVMRPPEKKAA